VLKSSAIAVPIDKDLKQGELRHILSDCGARVLFTEQSFIDVIFDIAESLPQLEKIVLLNHTPSQKGQLSPQAEQALSALVVEWHRLSHQYKIKDDDIQSFENLAESFHQRTLPTETEQADKKKNFFTRLLRDRDDGLARWRAAHPDRDPFEDRELEVISELPISVEDQIRAVEAARA